MQQIFSQTNFQYVCECGFSCLNREKPVLRTRLREHILGHIMHINIDDPSLDNCDTVKFVSDWIESTITSSHLNGHNSSTVEQKHMNKLTKMSLFYKGKTR